jgi:hypothetical protein
MAKSLQEMASEGADKLGRKEGIMQRNYEASKSQMLSNFNAMPFGPTIKQNYAEGVRSANYRAPDAGKWQRNWLAAMSR